MIFANLYISFLAQLKNVSTEQNVRTFQPCKGWGKGGGQRFRGRGAKVGGRGGGVPAALNISETFLPLNLTSPNFP